MVAEGSRESELAKLTLNLKKSCGVCDREYKFFDSGIEQGDLRLQNSDVIIYPDVTLDLKDNSFAVLLLP